MDQMREKREETCNLCVVQELRTPSRAPTGRVEVMDGVGAADANSSSLWASKVKVGDRFPTKKLMTVAVKRHLLMDGREGFCEKGGGRQAGYRCTGSVGKDKAEMGCAFRVTACLQTRHGINEWKITGLTDGHVNCSGVTPKRSTGQAPVKDVAEAIVLANPDITGPALTKSIQTQTGVRVKSQVSQRLKRKIVDEANVVGFQVVRSYLERLSHSSPETITDLQWDAEGHFKRLFVMLGQSTRVAIGSPLQLFSLDSCRLKGSWDGVLCLMTTRDAEDNVVLVAMVVAAVESSDMYHYLLTNVKRHAGMAAFVDKETTTCFVDQHEGSGSGISSVIPRTEVRTCVLHLMRNVKPEVGRNASRHILCAARAPTELSFDRYMEEAKKLEPASVADLLEYPLESWANHRCRKNRIGDQVITNMAESANDMIGHLRALSVFDLTKQMVELMAEKLNEAHKLMDDTPQAILTPHAESSREAELTASSQRCAVKTISTGSYIVSLQGKASLENRVRLRWVTSRAEGRGSPSYKCEEATCTCGYRARWGLPCRHLIAVCTATKTPERIPLLIDEGYKLEVYRALAYSPDLAVCAPVFSELKVDRTLKPPKRLKQAGRPRKGGTARRCTPSAGEVSTKSKSKVASATGSSARAGQERAGAGAGAGAGAEAQGSTGPRCTPSAGKVSTTSKSNSASATRSSARAGQERAGAGAEAEAQGSTGTRCSTSAGKVSTTSKSNSAPATGSSARTRQEGGGAEAEAEAQGSTGTRCSTSAGKVSTTSKSNSAPATGSSARARQEETTAEAEAQGSTGAKCIPSAGKVSTTSKSSSASATGSSARAGQEGAGAEAEAQGRAAGRYTPSAGKVSTNSKSNAASATGSNSRAGQEGTEAEAEAQGRTGTRCTPSTGKVSTTSKSNSASATGPSARAGQEGAGTRAEAEAQVSTDTRCTPSAGKVSATSKSSLVSATRSGARARQEEAGAGAGSGDDAPSRDPPACVS